MLLRRIARPMLASMFISGGIAALRAPQGHAQAAKPVLDAAGPVLDRAVEIAPIDQRPDDETLVKIDGAVKVVAGTLLALGRCPRLAATALAASLVPTTLAGHRFWESTDPAERQAQQLHFFKNVGVLGGLLIAAADTEGKPSLGWRARRAGRRAAAKAGAFPVTAADLSGRASGRASGAAAGLAAGLAGLAPGAAISSRAAELSERASKAVAQAEKKGAKLQRDAAKRSAKLRKRAAKRSAAWQKQAARTRRELKRKGPRYVDQLTTQAAKLGHDVAGRASAAGHEVAKQASGASKDARKRMAALTH